MNMTHYMELLASNQPWNLLIFMAVPVIFAETITITELYILYTRKFDSIARKINICACITVGIYFLGIFAYLIKNAVVPISAAGEWRTAVDIIAVGFYLLGVVPLFGMTLLELGIIGRNRDELWKLKIHSVFVAIFLVVAHVAMIAGMINPDIFSGTGETIHGM